MTEKENTSLLWKERIKQFKDSKLSMAKWCKENNLKVRTLQD